MVDRGGGLSLRRQCELLGVSRSSQYYEPLGESAANLALMRRLDELHLEHPFYGSRQMARHLRCEGVVAGRHRVRRLMRLMGMEAVYRKPRTGAANPEHRVYPCLLRDLVIDRPDQVWCADITYKSRGNSCRLRSRFVPDGAARIRTIRWRVAGPRNPLRPSRRRHSRTRAS